MVGSGTQIAFNELAKGSGFKAIGIPRKGRPWTPIPIWNFQNRTIGYTDTTVNKMKVIWQKYKVWLLIWLFYMAYYAIKSLIKLKSIDVQTARSGSYH